MMYLKSYKKLKVMVKTIDKLKFQDLMQYRVHEILLVASPYDAFILEQDGRLSEQILTEFKGMNLSYAPRIWNANTAHRALEMIKERPYDLVIIMLRISDMNPLLFAEKIKKKYPRKPIILLAFDESEVKALGDIRKGFDNVFIWTGNSHVFAAIIKYVEDKKNVRRDIEIGDVRVILLVEDNVRYYSTFYPEIYKQVLYYTKELMRKSFNDAHRLIRMRARPKILLAKNYEDAKKYFNTYQKNIIGVLSDIRFPKSGKQQKSGLKLAQYIKAKEPYLPVLLLSNREDYMDEALDITGHFISKKSGSLFKEIKEFIVSNLGFGDLILKTGKGKKIKSVSAVEDLKEIMEKLPLDSINYHASRNHFSNWLAIRGEFSLANKFRELGPHKFKNLEKRKEYHLKLLDNYEQNLNNEAIIEFDSKLPIEKYNFTKIGTGSLGGKARGLAFAANKLKDSKLSKKYPDINIRVPNITVIATDEFDKFMNKNKLWDIALNENNNSKLVDHFLNAKLDKKIIRAIKSLLKNINYPLAIRSSSLSEDSQYQSLSGMYSTFMLPNSSSSLQERVNQVCEAIKRIYASTFFIAPKSLIDKVSQRMEEEKMGIIIMEMIGQVQDSRFYPTFSGVAQSYNYYPTSYINRNDGVSYVALGLGKTVVDGNKSLRFCPKYPSLIHQFYSIKSTIDSSQNQFYALNMNKGKNPIYKGESHNLKLCNLDIAEKDGQLKYIGSVIPKDESILRDSLSYDGMRIVSFRNILKWETFPLSDILNNLLKFGKDSLGCPVEFEFAVNLNEDSDKNIIADFCVLQMKPMLIEGLIKDTKQISTKKENILFETNLGMGDGITYDIKNILMVKMDNFDISKSSEIALEIENMNDLMGPKNPYLLIGPGRWGSSDSWLGIPVRWEQISGAKSIIEMRVEGLNADPSFGSHFFHNLTNLRIGYLTQNKNNNTLDLDWINSFKTHKETQYLKWIKLKKSLIIQIDGSTGNAVILKEKIQPKEIIDENESLGI